MYLTLEPCFHNSKQGSCVNQIIKSGLKKIYVAKIDEDKRTKGKSISFLKKNKIKTFVGLTSKKTENLLAIKIPKKRETTETTSITSPLENPLKIKNKTKEDPRVLKLKNSKGIITERNNILNR